MQLYKIKYLVFCFPSTSLCNAVISVFFEVSAKQATHPFMYSTNRTLVPTTFKARGGVPEGHKEQQGQVEALESRTGAKEDTWMITRLRNRGLQQTCPTFLNKTPSQRSGSQIPSRI